jgi:hypothetical protein
LTQQVNPSWRALIESEAGRADRSDIGAVMTPNDSHYEICAAALDGGFHIICDKPLTTDLATAVDLARKVRATGTEFCLTYCYTGIRWCAKRVPWSVRERLARSGKFISNTFRVIWPSTKAVSEPTEAFQKKKKPDSFRPLFN